MSPIVIPLKQGATFRHRIRWPDSLIDYEVRSQVLLPQNARVALTARVILPEYFLPEDAPPPGFGIIEVSATAEQTALWPLRLLAGDVRCELAGEVAHTEDFYIDVQRRITL